MRTIFRAVSCFVVSACLAGTVWAQHGSDNLHRIVTPNDLKWEDLAAFPGAKIAVIEGKMNEAGPITARVKLPANFKLLPHYHPVAGTGLPCCPELST